MSAARRVSGGSWCRGRSPGSVDSGQRRQGWDGGRGVVVVREHVTEGQDSRAEPRPNRLSESCISTSMRLTRVRARWLLVVGSFQLLIGKRRNIGSDKMDDEIGEIIFSTSPPSGVSLTCIRDMETPPLRRCPPCPPPPQLSLEDCA